MQEITPDLFSDIQIPPHRMYKDFYPNRDGSYDEQMEQHQAKCREQMSMSLNATIDWLCKSPYMDRERLMNSQIPTIIEILRTYLSGKKAFILEAPTGVGKSIIGILIAESIRRYMRYVDTPCTYMLTSSKILQDQMDRDKDNFNLKWAVLKGQSNYTCNVNQKPFPERDCKDMSVSKAAETMTCSRNCGYIQARYKAMTWHAAIMSYAYWLTTMNFVFYHLGDYAPFQKRHVTIFDECHMMSEIVMNMFQTTISETLIKNAGIIHDLFLQIAVDPKFINKSLELQAEIKRLYPDVMKEGCSVQETFEALEKYYEVIHQFAKLCTLVCNRYLPDDSAEWLIEHKRIDSITGRIREYVTGVSYFINENANYIEYVVPTISTDKLNAKTMTLRSLREQAIIREHVHKFCDFQVFMSATIGDADVFAENNAIDDYDTMYLESTFDYTRSPIYRVGPPISMAQKQKVASMPELMHRILHICEERHRDERGIIHTGNFEISKNLREFIWEHSNNPHRFIFYTDAFSKNKALEKLQKSKNGIIIGPSLLEGLDLKDDLARFLIFAKVPYPMLDEYNVRKMKLMPDWYGWKTMTNVMQGLGRGVRSGRDWCVSYFLDSCFDFLFKKTRAPKYITSRFTDLNVGNLQQAFLNTYDEFTGLFNNSEGEVKVVKPVEKSVDDIDVESMLKQPTSTPELKVSGLTEYEDDLPF